MANHPRRSVEIPTDDPCPQLPVELGPKGEGVGSWVPAEKHRLVCNWLIGTRGAWRGWSKRILIDPFGGPGRIQVQGESNTRDGGTVIAWRQSVLNEVPFTSVLTGDIDQGRAEANEQRLRAHGAPVQRFVGPADKTVLDMMNFVPRRGCLTLAYLDPYNLQYLSFDIIKKLAELPAVDFLVHFSIYDLIRNIEMETDEDRARFDPAAPGWRQAIDPKKMSKQALRDAYFTYWCDQIKGLGFGISKSMPLIRADDNSPRYRLVFFTKNEKIASKVWTDVARGGNRELF